MSSLKISLLSILSSIMVAEGAQTSKITQNWADLNYICSHGQSLSVGWTANPTISNKQSFDNLMFEGGTRAYERNNNRNSLVPLIEGTDGPRGETPLSGATDVLSKSLKKGSHKIQFIGSATGVGGASIDGIGKGSQAYQRIMDDLKHLQTIATESGKKLCMPSFIWTQGETDQQNKQTKEWYKNKMSQLIADINTDAKAITGQTQDILCFGYQVGSHLHYYQHNPTYYPRIAIAQLEMALDDHSNYIMTTPMYHFDYSDGVHLTAPMSRLYGEYVGLTMNKVLVEGKKWKPLHPTSHRIIKKGKTWEIHLQFHVPKQPLVIDTKSVSDPGNYGFSITDDNNTASLIDSIQIKNGNTIIITTPSDPRKLRVRYGMTLDKHLKSGPQTGARGCLRDSQGNQYTTKIQDKTYRLDNWCPFFDYQLN